MVKNITLLVIGAMIVLIILQSNIKPKTFAIADIASYENILKQEYITEWGDALDGDIANKFDFGSYSYPDEKGITLSTPRDKSTTLTSKHNFYGQEVVILLIAQATATINNMQIEDMLGRNQYGIIIFRPQTLNLNNVDVIVDGITIKTITVDNPFYLRFNVASSGDTGSNARIEFIGYKAQFSCVLSQNERWIQTQWVDSVSIDDVVKKDGLIPTKFCKETRPFVLRDIQQGETDITPDPIPSFNRGCVIPNTGDCKTPKPLPSNQFIVVNYAVYQVQGLENPTTGTQAYKCIQRDLNYKCLGWVIEEVIKPVEVVVQCQVDSDCPLPLTQFQDTSCLGYFKGCQNKKCVYDNTILEAPKCQNQVVTIVKQIQEVDKRTVIPVEGSNIFTFSQNKDRGSFNIGDLTFSASLPQYTCSTSSLDTINPPKPSSSCWRATINLGGNSFSIQDNQELTILKNSMNTSLINLRYFASGTYVINQEFKQPNDKTSFRNDDWGNTFIFTILPNALTLDVEDSSFVLKDSIKQIKLNLINNLPSGNVLIKIQQRVRATNQNLPEQTITKKIIKGNNDLLIDLNTQNLGLNTITIQIFYKIEADRLVLIPTDKIILTYDIVNELPTITKVVEVERIIEKPIIVEKPILIREATEKTKISPIVWIVVGIIILLILLNMRRRL